MKYISLICLAVLFSGCKDRAQRAAEYNDAVISYQAGIIDAFSKLDSAFRDTSASYPQIQNVYAALQNQVQLGILGLDSVGSFQKDPSLQLAARDLFRQYDRLVDQEYARLVEICGISPENITVAIVDSSNTAQSRIDSILNVSQEEFLRIQQEFGKKYHLEFE